MSRHPVDATEELVAQGALDLRALGLDVDSNPKRQHKLMKPMWTRYGLDAD